MRYASIAIVVMMLALVPVARAEPALEQMLAGKWLVFWTAEGRVSAVSIDHVRPQGNLTGFDGSILQGDERCPLTGTVISASQLDYTDGIEGTAIKIPAVARLSVSCSNIKMTMEVLGLSDSKFLMSGRAIITVAGGAQLIQPIGMSPAP